MIRFVDLRGQDTDGRFAFFDTVPGRFVDLLYEQVWNTWDEFEEAYLGQYASRFAPNCTAREKGFLGRCRGLCPPWAFVPDLNDGWQPQPGDVVRVRESGMLTHVRATVEDGEGFVTHVSIEPHGATLSLNEIEQP